MSDVKYYRVVVAIDRKSNGVVKRHSLRVGSASVCPDGSIAIYLETAPIVGWDGKMRLFPADMKEEEYETEEG